LRPVGGRNRRVNTMVKMSESKVVDIVDHSKLEDVEKLVFCRCWKSKNYPFCDGAHVAHNKATGDNLGCVQRCKGCESLGISDGR
jgi:CDGSH-type Zn-finger protein